MAAWHDGLPGTDWAHPEPAGGWRAADRMLAFTAVLTFYRPDIADIRKRGRIHPAMAHFMDWLTPAQGEPWGPEDGFFRRQALIRALSHHPPNSDPATVVSTAVMVYQLYRDERLTPLPDRKPLRAYRVAEPAPVG